MNMYTSCCFVKPAVALSKKAQRNPPTDSSVKLRLPKKDIIPHAYENSEECTALNSDPAKTSIRLPYSYFVLSLLLPRSKLENCPALVLWIRGRNGKSGVGNDIVFMTTRLISCLVLPPLVRVPKRVARFSVAEKSHNCPSSAPPGRQLSTSNCRKLFPQALLHYYRSLRARPPEMPLKLFYLPSPDDAKKWHMASSRVVTPQEVR